MLVKSVKVRGVALLNHLNVFGNTGYSKSTIQIYQDKPWFSARFSIGVLGSIPNPLSPGQNLI